MKGNLDIDSFINNIRELTDNQLMSFRATIEAEMKKRGIALSVGEIGEALAISYFNSHSKLPNLQAAPTGTKNIDALSRNGDRYSIKTRLSAKKTGTIYPDNIDKDKQLFEYILLVKIDENYNLGSIHQFDWSQFCELRSWDKRMTAWYLSCSNNILLKAAKLL